MNIAVDVPTHARTSPRDFAPLFAKIAAGAAERDRDRILPFAEVDAIKAARLGALRVPVAQGGLGGSIRDLLGTVIALGAADPNVAHILRNHFVFVDRYIRAPRNEAERRLQKAVAEGAIVGLASGELGKTVGRTSAYETSLTPEGDGYRLNGTKYYSTGSLYADFILIRATLPDGRQASAVLPRGRDGLELIDDWDGMGQRLTGTGTTRLSNVLVSADEVIADSDGANYSLPYGTVLPQLFLTSILAGILRGLAEEASALVRRRGGRSYAHATAERPSEDPLLQQVVGQIASLAFAAEATVLAAADAVDRSLDSANGNVPDLALAHEASLSAAQAKVVLDEITTRAAGLLFDVGGASATKRSDNLDRHWRNARTLASHNPSLYKAKAIGDYRINGTLLPQSGFF